MRPKVYISRRIPETALALVKEACEVTQWDEEKLPVPREILLKEAADCDGLYALLTDRVDEELLDRAPKLKIVANMAVGYDNIDVDACTRRGIAVTNTPDVLTETTADLTFALLMATARRFQEARRVIDQDQWVSWYPMMLAGQDVYGATLGIVGAGRIGQAVARRALGFNMKILYHNRNRAPSFEAQTGAIYVSFDDLLRNADFVVSLVPLTAETRHMFGAREFGLMKPSAVFINVARGAVVDEVALYHALKEGQIWAAGLDVFEKEPIDSSHPLVSLPNCTVLPHIGSASIRTRIAMAELAAKNLVAGLQGKRPPNVVNPEVFESHQR